MKKKIFSILLTLVLMASILIGLTACGGDNNDDNTEKNSRIKVNNSALEKETMEIKANKLDALEVSQFNQQFTNYEGKQLGSGVIDLIDKVVDNASANSDFDERLPDVIYLDTRATSAALSADKIDSAVEIVEGSDEEAIYKAAGFTSTYNSAFLVESDSSAPHISEIGSLRSKIAEKHYYQVEFHNDSKTGLIGYIIICY